MNRLTYLLGALLFLSFSSHANAQSPDAFIGIHVDHIKSKKAKLIKADNRYGSYVTRIVKESAAEAANLQALDYIYGVNNETVNSEQNLDDLLNKYQPNDPVTLMVVRDGQRITKAVTLGKREGKGPTKEGSFLGVNHNRDDQAIPGALIGNAEKGTNAEKMGLLSGDIIIRINQFPLKDWHDLSYIMDNIDPCDPIQLRYYRGGEVLETKTFSSRTSDADDMPDCNQDPTEVVLREEEEIALLEAALQIAIEELSEEEMEDMAEEQEVALSSLNSLEIESLNIFPNPSRGIFNLQLNLRSKGDAFIRIYSLDGKKVYENVLTEPEGEFQNVIDISNNAAGTYILQIQQNGYSMTRKLVIARG